MAAAAVTNVLKWWGALESKGGASIWTAWLDFLGLVGVSALCQVSPLKSAEIIEDLSTPSANRA